MNTFRPLPIIGVPTARESTPVQHSQRIDAAHRSVTGPLPIAGMNTVIHPIPIRQLIVR